MPRLTRHATFIVSVQLCVALAAPHARAEDGYELWLRYRPIETVLRDQYRAAITHIVAEQSTPAVAVAIAELRRGLTGLLAREIPTSNVVAGPDALVIGTPSSSRRADWSATYYHRADARGIGFDRTRKGSGAVDQYYPPLRDRWNDPALTPQALLLWFHRLPWDYRLSAGQTLWDGLVEHYDRGVEQAEDLESQWARVRGKVDAERFAAVAARLRRQAEDAAAWRDKCLRYFQQFSKRSLPPR